MNALSSSERAFLALFFGGLLLAPLAGPDLFPYSTFPMFSDATRALSRLEVSGPDGPLPSAAFGLASDYVMNRNVWVGRAIPPGPNPLGRPADPALVAARVRARWPTTDPPAWIEVREVTLWVDAAEELRREETARWRFTR
jgi:hypothetical protein